MYGLLHDLRHALRRLRSSPGFALLAIATMALAIGATTAVFSAVHAVLIRPLPFAEPDRLVLLWHRTDDAGSHRVPIPAPDVALYREEARGFRGLAFMARPTDVTLGGGPSPGRGGHGPARVRLARVTPDFFPLLGVRPALGRTFHPGEGLAAADGRREGPRPLVLDHGFWRRRFGGDPGAVGRTIRLEGRPALVVGVLPEDFRLPLPPAAGIPARVDAWSPLEVSPADFRRENRLRDRDADNTGVVVGRLRPGTSLTAAAAEMDGLAARQREERPGYGEAGTRIDVRPLEVEAVAHVRPLLVALQGAVALVLLVACLDLANLLLLRSVGRRREFFIRAALGASRARLVRQRLTEGALLATLGGVAGLPVARWGIELLRPLAGPGVGGGGLAGGPPLRLDGPVLAAAVGIIALSVLLSSLLPALLPPAGGRAGASGASPGPQPGSRTGAGGRLRAGLIVAEVGLSLALLAGGGLVARSLAKLTDVDPGFRPERAVTFRLGRLSDTVAYRGPAQRASFLHRLESRLAELSGVEAVGSVGSLPLDGRAWTQPYGPEGSAPEEWHRSEAVFRSVTSGYFRALGTALLAGRAFTPREDLREERRVVIVDAALARRLTGTADPEDALGRRVGFPLDGAPVWADVVGVVERVRHEDLRREGRETLYVPYRQEASREVAVAVRGSSDPGPLVPAIRRTVAELDPGLPVYDVRGLEEYVARAAGPERFAVGAIGSFALLALLLAAVGLYGVIGQEARGRRREFGIRMAVGARQADILRDVLGRTVRLVGLGALLGLGLAAAGSAVLSSLLYGVGRFDPATYAAVSALLAAVALLATWGPARHAARSDPMAVLRHE